MVAWGDAGRPETDAGSTGQQRQHHLAAAVERAGRHFDALTAKIERAANRRLPRNRIPEGARVVGKLVGGGSMIVATDGRLYQQSAVDRGEWTLSWSEVMCDDGCQLRWMGEDGTPVFCEPPPTRAGWEITEDEAYEWAERWEIPRSAVAEWLERPNRRGRLTCRDDVDIPSVRPRRRV